MRVAAIGTWIDGIVVDEGFEPVAAWMGPAMYESLGSPSAGFGGAVVRLRDPDDTRRSRRPSICSLRARRSSIRRRRYRSRRRSGRHSPPRLALAIFAGVTAILGLLLVGQAISRHVQLDALDNDTLAAIGATRQERFVSSMVRLTLAAIVGAVLAVVLAAGLSVFTPVGPARFAEPDPGFSLRFGDPPRWDVRVRRCGRRHRDRAAWHGAGGCWTGRRAPCGSAIATWLAARGASISLTTGVRFGLEPGRGSSAVPTRATIIGAATAVTVAVATIVFTSSLDRVVDEPRFYGSNFDVALDFDGDIIGDAAGLRSAMDVVASDPAVARSGELRIGEILIGERKVTTLAFSSGPDAIPTDHRRGACARHAGRSSARCDDDERPRRRHRRHDPARRTRVCRRGCRGRPGRASRCRPVPRLGSHVDRYRSVGRARHPRNRRRFDEVVAGRRIRPGCGHGRSPGTSRGIARLPSGRSTSSRTVDPRHPEPRSSPFASRCARGSARGAGVGDGAARNGGGRSPRRRDVAILQALGSTTRSVTAIGVWQGLTIGAAALLFGVPLGIVVGRWVWILLANGFGTLAEPLSAGRGRHHDLGGARPRRDRRRDPIRRGCGPSGRGAAQ